MKKRNIALAALGVAAGAVAVKMLTRAATVDFDAVRDLVPHSDKSRLVHVDGMRIHYQEFGDAAAPVVILLHGYTSSVYAWHRSAPLIAAKGFRVIAVDLVGSGYSEKPRHFEYSIEAQARVITRFMDRLGIGRAVLVGSSYGGSVAATIGLDWPERAEKLVLVDTVINDDLKTHLILRLGAIPGVGEVITPFLAESAMLQRYRMRGTLGGGNQDLITDERVESILRPLRAADAHHSLLATVRNWHATRITRDAHLITHATLIIWGQEDTTVPLRDGYTLRDSIAGSRLIVIRNCGHAPQEEQPEIFSKLVAEFCVTG